MREIIEMFSTYQSSRAASIRRCTLLKYFLWLENISLNSIDHENNMTTTLDWVIAINVALENTIDCNVTYLIELLYRRNRTH